MPGPRKKNITLRDNADYGVTFGFKERGGRGIDDLVITSGSVTATSVTANFTIDDDGKKIAIADDNGGITDGTTMTFVDAETVTLSAAATADRENCPAVIRALNTSAYTNVGAWVKKNPNDRLPALILTVDSTRKAVGIWAHSAIQADIKLKVKHSGHWDWIVNSAAGDSVWYEGLVTFVKGTTDG